MWMADGIAIVADVNATICFIVVDVMTTCYLLMLLPNMWWLMLSVGLAKACVPLKIHSGKNIYKQQQKAIILWRIFFHRHH